MLDIPELQVARNFCDEINYSVDFAARPGTVTEHAMAMGAGPSWVFEYPDWNVSERDMQFHADHVMAIMDIGRGEPG